MASDPDRARWLMRNQCLNGIKLMPRIRNWKDLCVYKAEKGIRYKHIDHLFSDVIAARHSQASAQSRKNSLDNIF